MATAVQETMFVLASTSDLVTTSDQMMAMAMMSGLNQNYLCCRDP